MPITPSFDVNCVTSQKNVCVGDWGVMAFFYWGVGGGGGGGGGGGQGVYDGAGEGIHFHWNFR